MKKNKLTGKETSRRHFLKTAGKVAVYTPPAMMAVSNPSFAQIARSSGNGLPNGDTKTLDQD